MLFVYVVLPACTIYSHFAHAQTFVASKGVNSVYVMRGLCLCTYLSPNKLLMPWWVIACYWLPMLYNHFICFIILGRLMLVNLSKQKIKVVVIL